MIGVVGSLNLDLVARVPAIPAPGETVLGQSLARHHGGKGGNQAVAAVRLGVPVAFVGAVGRDAFGDELAAGLAAEGIDTTGLVRADAPSGCALINVSSSGENAITVLPGANQHAPGPPAVFPPWRWLLMQLELPLPTVLAWAEAAQAAGVKVMLNAAPMAALPAALLAAVDVLVLNQTELAALAGGDLQAAAAQGPRSVVATLGARGAVAWHERRRIEQAAHDVWAVDTTGAGDSFTGALAASLWQGRPFEQALARAAFAASLSCMKAGARGGLPTAAELDRALSDWQHDDDATR